MKRDKTNQRTITLNPTTLSDLLSRGGATTPKKMEVFDGGILLEATTSTNKKIYLTISDEGIHLSPEDFKTLNTQPEQTPHARRRHYVTHHQSHGESVDVLRELGLPLYWNEEWLRERLKELGSYAEIARTYPEEVHHAQGTSIANYARERFNIRPRNQLGRQRDQILREYEEHQPITQSALAETYGITVSTISRWIREAHAAYQDLQMNPDAVKTKDGVAEFAAKHNLESSTIKRWMKQGSRIYGTNTKQQPKAHYHTRDDYADKHEEVARIFTDSKNRKTGINKSALAKRLALDRSTVTKWLKELETIHSA